MVVLVTGCRSGFGRLIAVRAAEAGHKVWAGVRDATSAAALEAELANPRIRVIPLEVTDPAARTAAVAHILAEDGRIDALINNAGVALGGPLEELEEDELRHLMEVNLFAVWSLTNLVLPPMRQQGSGHIINISSISGRMAVPGLGAYAASKFALEGMSEALRVEVAPFGIRVALVEPGPYKTDILGRNRTIGRNVGKPDSAYAALSRKADALFTKVAATAGDPEAVARKVVGLLGQSAPALRHPMGMSANLRLLLRWALPGAVYEQILLLALNRAG